MVLPTARLQVPVSLPPATTVWRKRIFLRGLAGTAGAPATIERYADQGTELHLYLTSLALGASVTLPYGLEAVVVRLSDAPTWGRESSQVIDIALPAVRYAVCLAAG